MDEIELLRLFRDQVPERDDAARQVARARLAAALQQPAAARTRLLWRSRRVWVAVAATLAAVAIVSSALGWTSRLIDAITGAPAPPRVKHAFAVRNEARAREVALFRQSSSFDTIIARVHGVIGINSSLGPVIIWAAPTKGGGVCWQVEVRGQMVDGRQNGSGGCEPHPRRYPNSIRYAHFETRVGPRTLRLLDGRAGRAVKTVEVRYADGKREQLPVIGGFFLDELRADSKPTLLIARARSGGELERFQLAAVPQAPTSPPPQPWWAHGRERILIRLQTSGGHTLTFGIGHDTFGDFCEHWRYRGSDSSGCSVDPRGRVAADELSIHPNLLNEAADRKPLVTLEGVVGSKIARLELRYSDGTAVPVPITDRFVIFEIPPGHHQDTHFVLHGYNRAGEQIARRAIH